MLTAEEIRTAIQTGTLLTLEAQLDARDPQWPSCYQQLCNLVHELVHSASK